MSHQSWNGICSHLLGLLARLISLTMRAITSPAAHYAFFHSPIDPSTDCTHLLICRFAYLPICSFLHSIQHFARLGNDQNAFVLAPFPL
jgi:hypothetical protein